LPFFRENAVKGIILAGGSGTRLYPLTRVISKQLIPVYDKPMIYYPMSVLMLAGIRDILIISTPQDLPRFRELFEDGDHLGLRLSYAEQPRPEGLAQAFLIGQDFIGDDAVCLVLGDNIFFGHNFAGIVRRCAQLTQGGIIFGYLVRDPQRYGVVEFDQDNRVVGIEEKPKQPKSRYAVPGLYFYDNKVVEVARSIKPSARGELEITDINTHYLSQGQLTVELLGRGFCWLDTGTHESLQQAASYVQAVQDRQGLKIACLEEIAYRLGYINASQVERLAASMMKNQYGMYLMDMLNESNTQGTAD
jgi:glucose-1-phosphate thymidylyltransferase